MKYCLPASTNTFMVHTLPPKKKLRKLRPSQYLNYHMALIEYENCVILKEELQSELGDKIDRIKLCINPETRIIKTCLEKGEALYNEGDFKTSNKYYSKAMLLANENSSEYRLAKSRVVTV